MKNIHDTLIHFLQKQTCATICCSDENGNPYCFSCYYSFNNADGLLYFKSSPASQHSILLQKNRNIAGTVLPDKISKLITRGVQFQGELLDQFHSITKDAFANYHLRHPLAIGFKGNVYVIQINQVKMTDNSLGFGKKIIWERECTITKK